MSNFEVGQEVQLRMNPHTVMVVNYLHEVRSNAATSTPLVNCLQTLEDGSVQTIDIHPEFLLAYEGSGYDLEAML